MLAIGTMGLQLMQPFVNVLATSLTLVCTYMCCSFVQASILKLMRGLRKKDIFFLQYRVGQSMMITPEAAPIFMAVLFIIMGRLLG